MRRGSLLVAILLLASGSFVAAPPAEAASTPITITCGPSPGATLSAPGTYTLSTAVANCTSSPIVSITSPGVTLDLAGRIIDGNDGNAACVIATGMNLSGIRVKNGVVSDCDQGVNLVAATKSSVAGIVARSTDLEGITIGNSSSVTDSTTVAALIGIAAVNGNTISGNTVTFSTFQGISAVQGNKITNNHAFKNNAGIVATQTNSVTKNTAAGNITGILVEDGNTVSRNSASGNSGSGIVAVDTGSTITKNTTNGNGDAGISAADESTISKNTSTGNNTSGISIDAQIDNVISNTTVKSNVANGNGLNGIVFVDPVDGATTKVKSNTSNGNVQQGIDLNGGTPIGAGTNKAGGNIVGTQCDGGLCVTPAPSGTPVTITCGPSPGATISTPGTYTVATSVVDCASAVILLINTDDVTLQMDGRILDGVDGAQTCISATRPGDPVHDVEIKNGTVRDCNDGIDFNGGPNSATRMVARSNVGNGIQDATLAESNTVVDNNIGIEGGGESRGNTAALNVTGIQMNGGTASDNISVANTGAGIHLNGQGSVVDGNTAGGNGGDGLRFEGVGSTISGNSFVGNVEDGIEANGGNTIEKNTTVSNGFFGIETGDQQVPPPGIVFNTSVLSNKSLGNVASGIWVDADDNLINGVTVSSNVTNGNSSDGITFIDPLFGSSTAVNKNTANGSFEQGINLNGGVPSGVGTNKAAGNIMNPQCDDGLCV